MRRTRRGVLCCALASVLSVARAEDPPPALTAPAENRRNTEQTFLTYPEWFLVFSPAEYAAFVQSHTPDEFPFLGHTFQYWQGWAAVVKASRDYPTNVGYQVMILVIGASASFEYGVRSVYETLVGRLAALTAFHGTSAEDALAAKIAQEYVDFIRVRPWYEFDYVDKLWRLWAQCPWWGDDMLRKWERRYALTTEYAGKAIYGWMTMKGTKAAYDAELQVTAAVVDRLPEGSRAELLGMQVLAEAPDGAALVLLPRYQAFQEHAMALVRRGAKFQEIAGNRSLILVSVLVPDEWEPAGFASTRLFTQEVLTQPGTKRVAMTVPVASLDAALRALDTPPLRIEHVYDY